MPRGVGDVSSAASGRPAMALTRDSDWEDLVRAVNSLPKMAESEGIDTAIAWGMTELRSILDLLGLGEPRTAEDAKAAHRLHIALTEGFLRVMARSDRAGFLLRRDFLAAAERQHLAPTLRAVFNRTTADTRSPYVPITGER